MTMDPLPTLSYADPTVWRSKPGRLNLETTDTGFILSDSRSADNPRWLLYVCGVAALIVSAMFIAGIIIDAVHHDFEWPSLLCPTVGLAFMLTCLQKARRPIFPPRVITFHNGQLAATGLSWMTRRLVARLHQKPSQLKTVKTEYLVLHPRFDLRITFLYASHRTLFPALTLDEAIWAQGLLLEALKSKSQQQITHT